MANETSNSIESREAKHGEKMIEVKVRFWTNGIAESDGHVLPKHAWSSGVVRMEGNATHDIVPGQPQPFHSLMDIAAIVEKVLIQHKIVLHPSTRARKYLNVE